MFQKTHLILFLSAILATQTVMPMHRMAAKLRTATFTARNNAILRLRAITNSAPEGIASEATQTPKPSFVSRAISSDPVVSYVMFYIASVAVIIFPRALYDSYTKNLSPDKQKTLMTELAKTKEEKNNTK